jgi:hypothetical protein
MSSDFDPADFVDRDFQVQKAPQTATTSLSGTIPSQRAPTREEVDSKVTEAQQRLAELKRVQEELERERASLEETRRRRIEFQTGRQEMIQNLTRGVGLLEEAEFSARLDAEQMAKVLAEFRHALSRIETVQEEAWTKDNFNVELTRGLTAVENARMEWNAARLKFPVLSGQSPANREAAAVERAPEQTPFKNLSFGQCCKMGLALTWPLTAVALIALIALLVVLFVR